MATIDSRELGRRLKQFDQFSGTVGVRLFDVATAEAQTLVNGADRFYPGEGWGKGAPEFVGYKIQADPRRPGRSNVILHYRTLAWREWLQRYPNHGVLMTKSAAEARKLRQIKIGGRTFMIEGRDTSDNTGMSFYRVVSGDNTFFLPVRRYTVYAVTNNRVKYVTNMLPLVGYWNTNGMGRFHPDCKRGRLLLASCQSRPCRNRYPLLEVWYDFLYRDEGWNTQLRSEQLRVQVREEEVLDADGAATGDIRHVKRLAPTGVFNWFTKGYANFDLVQNLLKNSW